MSLNKQIFELSGAVGYTSTWVVPTTGATSGYAQKIAFKDLVQTGLGSGYITSGMLGDNSVNSGNISSGSIGQNHLRSGLIQSLTLGSGQVTSGVIAPFSVLNSNIVSGTVANDKLANSTIIIAGSSTSLGGAWAAQALTTSSGLLAGTYYPSGGLTIGIASGGIVAQMMASGSVTTNSIASGSVNTNQLASGAVGPNQLASGSVGVAGLSGQIQFNNGGVLGANTGLSFNAASGSLILGSGDAFINGLTVGKGKNVIAGNTAIGVSALNSIGSGSFNVAVGFQTLGAVTSGYGNTAVGYQAGFGQNEFGNTFIGYQAGFTSGNAIRNTYIGYFAGNKTTSGTTNTAIGYEALYSNTMGERNVAVGYEALYFNTLGTRNTGLGHAAGIYQADGSTQMNSGINSVYIGADCRGFDNADSNSIVIGYLAIGQGANTTVIGSTSTTSGTIYGNINLTRGLRVGSGAMLITSGGDIYTSGRVGIGMNTPSGKLTVKSTGQSTRVFQLMNSQNSNSLFDVFESSANFGAMYLYDSAGTALTQFVAGSSTPSYVNTGAGFGIGTSTPSGALHVETGAAAKIGTIIRGFTSQSANLTEWQNSANAQIASINASGVLTSEVGITFQTLSTNGSTPFIVPAPAGGSTPSAKGNGFGRNILIQGGTTDNTTSGALGGDVQLRGGAIIGQGIGRGRVILADDGGAAIFGSGLVYSGTMAAVYPRNNATRGIQLYPSSGYNTNLLESFDQSGNSCIAITGSGTLTVPNTINLGFGNTFSSGLTIKPFGAGGGAPSERGIGFGKILYIEAGASDNTAGTRGGDLVLRGGPATSPGSGTGMIYLADINTQTTFVGMPIFMSGTSAPTSGKFHIYQSGNSNSFTVFENASSTAANGSHLWLRRGVNDAFIANYDNDIRFFTTNITDERARISSNSGNFVVKSVSGQVTDLQQWQNLSGLAMAKMNNSGYFFGVDNMNWSLVNTQASGTVSLTATSPTVQIADTRSGNITYQLPTVPNLSGQLGCYFTFKKADNGANSMTIIPASGLGIDGNLSGLTTTTAYQSYRTIFNGSGWYII